MRMGNEQRADVNCTPIVRQYDILNNDWGAVQCLSARCFVMFYVILADPPG
ncbi:MAG: hypothetical protein RR051_07540 [Clostridiales bacterium]